MAGWRQRALTSHATIGSPFSGTLYEAPQVLRGRSHVSLVVLLTVPLTRRRITLIPTTWLDVTGRRRGER